MLTDRRPILLANARLIDPARDFDGIGAIFAHAALTAEGAPGETRGADAIAEYYRSLAPREAKSNVADLPLDERLARYIIEGTKDGLNAVGIGAWFNVTDLGQVLLLHVCLLPLVVAAITVLHVLLVRKRGVVPPIDTVDHIVEAESTEVSR